MEPVRKKGKTIHSEARNIVGHIIQECDNESRNGRLTYSLDQANLRAANYTGISVRTVSRIRKDISTAPDTSLSTPGKHRKRPEERNVTCDDFDRRVIRDVIEDFYLVQKRVPTCPKLLAAIRDKIDFPWGVHTLRRILKEMGFKWKKCGDKRKILVERPNIVHWRCEYLKSMRRFREEKRPIVYVDESWVDSNLTFNKCWQSENQPGVLTNTSSSNRLIIVHAGTQDGFLNGSLLIFKAGKSSGDYHGQMNAENFQKWISEMLLPNLPEKSVVVLDNASYHCVQTNKHPTKYSTNKDMKSWLERNNVEFRENMRKCELFTLIQLHKSREKTYRIDEILKSHGHDIIRLPPYMCELNAIELAWAKTKRLVRENNTSGDFSLAKMEDVTRRAISIVSKEDWKGYCLHVQKIEERYWETDGRIEDVVDTFIIRVDSDSASSDSSDEDVSSTASELAKPLSDTD